MVNPPLLFVSALFFLGVSALLYSGACLLIKVILGARPGQSPHRNRWLLSMALILPPVSAGAFTAGGAFLRHSHAPGALHQNVYCGEIAHFLALPEGKLPVLLGLLVQGAAWLLVAWGVLTMVRLVRATIALERGLSPYLHPPSEKLSAALSRLPGDTHCTGLEFFESDIPMAFSCLIGIRRIRCVLSRQLVASATREELECIVLHEINHFRSGDVRRTLVVGMLNCLFYYLPPVSLLSQRWREETELACDAATARATGAPLALASAILRTQGVPVYGRHLPGTTLGFAEETACSPQKRVERLLAYAQGGSAAIEMPGVDARQWIPMAILLFAGLLLLLSPDSLCMAHCSLEAVSRTLH